MDFIKMVSITLEGLWMVSDKIVDFQFFVKFHRSGHAKIFSFWTITEHVSYPSKKVPNQAKIYVDFIQMVSTTLEGLWMVSDRIVDFRFFIKFHRSGPVKICSLWTITDHVQKRFLIKPRLIWTSSRWWAKIFSFWTITEHVSYQSKMVPNQAKIDLDFIKMVSITLEGLWMVLELLIFDFSSNFTGPDLQKFSVFELSWSMLVINQKRFLIKPRLIRTSWRWWVLPWKDYGWFLIELSIFDFSSNFTGPDLQKFSVFELSRNMLVINQKRFLFHPRLIRTSWRWSVLLRKDYGWFLLELLIFDFSSNFTGPDLQKFSVFELTRSMLAIHQKRFLIKPRFIWTSSRWWVLLWKDYGWFQIELLIFDFSSNFTGPDLQKFSVFELSRSMLVINQKRFLIKPRFIWTSRRWLVLLWKDFGWFQIELLIFDFSSNFTGPGPAKIFSFWTITEHVTYPSKKSFESSQDLSGLHQDGEYYSGRIMDGFW